MIDAAGAQADGEEAIDAWVERNEVAVERCMAILADINASRAYDTTTLPVALREVRNLIHADGGGWGRRHGRVQDGGRDRPRCTGRADRDKTRISPPSPPLLSADRPEPQRRGHEHEHVDHAGHQKGQRTGHHTACKSRKHSAKLSSRTHEPRQDERHRVARVARSRAGRGACREVERRIQQAARELGRQMRIPGFRRARSRRPS